ncbi:ABC transporter ATP-binding protein [Noviherbaspirillum soli]|uniref:ABC transporter ATP-binding protein n=1 Tax=Noviherbaspirillum soli TaxID=1064518 RepID=UPI00188A984D|nr:oligopeptide/dipeptide ABC transporter ATP-binding protein [Noviherbaspirillum soli]
MTHNETLLVVKDLKVHFRRQGSLFAKPSVVHAVDGVSFKVRRGTTLAIVGESGSGKTTTALSIMRLAPITSGSVAMANQEITHLEGTNLRRVRRNLQIIFQDPYSSLNPRVRVGAAVRAPLDQMNIGLPAERDERVAALFRSVGLRPEQQHLFPHQFSGGQRQRINIARALASKPDLVICDEPVSALDVAVRAQTLNLLQKLQKEMGLTYLFISHDMAVVEHMCDEIAVMYMGRIVERAPRHAFFDHPLHPYSWALMSAVPALGGSRTRVGTRIQLKGDPPNPIDPPPGCRFAPRCPFAVSRCRERAPELRAVGPLGREVACHLIDDTGATPHPRLYL